MKILKDIINSVLLGTITTLIIVVVSFFRIIFSGGEDGLRTAFFNSIFFKSVENSSGSVDMSFGIYNSNFQPILISIILFAFISYLFFYFYKILNQRQIDLMKK